MAVSTAERERERDEWRDRGRGVQPNPLLLDSYAADNGAAIRSNKRSFSATVDDHELEVSVMGRLGMTPTVLTCNVAVRVPSGFTVYVPVPV